MKRPFSEPHPFSEPSLENESFTRAKTSGIRNSKMDVEEYCSGSASNSSKRFRHVQPVIDRLDVCECSSTCRRSASVCRESLRTSSILLDEVVEKNEEEPIEPNSSSKCSVRGGED